MKITFILINISVADVIRRFPSRFSFTLVDSTIGTDKGASVKLVGMNISSSQYSAYNLFVLE
jgi:hypothetical protein